MTAAIAVADTFPHPGAHGLYNWHERQPEQIVRLELRVERFPQAIGLGTMLRHLIELMDGDVDQVYLDQDLDCRSRYTPVIRHLMAHGPSTIKAIALASGLTHSAASQTVASMLKAGLLRSQSGSDGRERIISFSPKGKALLPRLKQIWEAIGMVETELCAEDGVPLRSALQSAICALERTRFRERITKKLD